MACWSSEYIIKVKRESGSSSVLEVARVAKSMPGEYDVTERQCDVPKVKADVPKVKAVAVTIAVSSGSSVIID